MNRLAAAAQNAGVAGFDAQAGGIGGHVRTRFVDDADDAERHAHAPDLDAGWAVFKIGNFADRIREACDLAQTLGHGLDARDVQFQTVEQGGIETRALAGVEVLFVGRDQRVPAALDLGGDGGQRRVLGRGFGARHGARGNARALPDVLHVRLDVVRRDGTWKP